MKDLPVANEPGSTTSVSPAAPFIRRRAFVLLGSYFLLHTLFRVLVSDSAELDESEQVLCAQAWHWGYGAAPPLYHWLQALAFQVFGINIFALALLKNLLLFGAFVFTYLSAKEITGDEGASRLSMLSLLLFPQITWESQRDLTHSVLATTLAAATFFLALRLVRLRSPACYFALGACVGLGTLSKYNYCVVALALLLAGFTIPTYRRVLASKWILLSLAGFLLVTSLHFRWALLNHEAVLSRSGELIEGGEQLVVGWGLGFLSLGKAAVMLSGVLVAVYYVVFRRAANTRLATRDFGEVRSLINRTLFIVLLVCTASVFLFATQFKDRWFQPLVFLMAIAAALLVHARLTPAAERRVCLVVAVLALTALVVLPIIPLAAPITNRPTRLNAPYALLSEQLKAIVPNPHVIVADSRLVAGNLKLFFSESSVVAPEFHALPLPKEGPWLMVWNASKGTEPPERLVDLVKRLRGADLAASKSFYIEAAYKYTRSRTMKLGCALVPGKT